MDKHRELFTKRLREKMDELDLNQTELGAKLGVPQSQVSSYLLGKIEPGLKVIGNFAEALDCDISDLLSEKPAYTPTNSDSDKLALIALILGCDGTKFKAINGPIRRFLEGFEKDEVIPGAG